MKEEKGEEEKGEENTKKYFVLPSIFFIMLLLFSFLLHVGFHIYYSIGTRGRSELFEMSLCLPIRGLPERLVFLKVIVN